MAKNLNSHMFSSCLGKMYKLAPIFLLVITTCASMESKQLIEKAATVEVRDDVTWKIVGGSTAASGQFPYIVSIRDRQNRHFCGGSIINNRWILTAAHCMVNVYAGNIMVVVGTNTLSYGGTAYLVSHIVSHPQFGGHLKNDIALIHLAGAISYSAYVQPISVGAVGGGATSTLSGWGSVFLGSQSPNALQYINLRTLDVGECQQYLPEVGAGQLCTLTSAGQGACHGDSGGPLSSGGLLIGVVSYGKPCAQGMPDVFTRVSAYLPWIKANMY